MPILNSALVARNFKKDILEQATMEGIDPSFQQTVESELSALAPNTDRLSARHFPALYQLDLCIASICLTHRQLCLSNIPEAIVEFLKSRINRLSLSSMRLQTVFINEDEWMPSYSTVEVDDDAFDFSELSDDEEFVLVVDDRKITLPETKAVDLPSPADLHRAVTETSDPLANSLSSLSGSTELDDLQKSISKKEEELKSSNEDLSRSLNNYNDLFQSTRSVMHKLVAATLLNRYDGKHSRTRLMKAQEDQQQYMARSNHTVRSMAEVYNSRLFKAQEVNAKHEKREALKQQRDALQQQLLSMSCPPSFFAASQATETPVDLNQSVIIPRHQVPSGMGSPGN